MSAPIATTERFLILAFSDSSDEIPVAFPSALMEMCGVIDVMRSLSREILDVEAVRSRAILRRPFIFASNGLNEDKSDGFK